LLTTFFKPPKTTFFKPPKSVFQNGILAVEWSQIPRRRKRADTPLFGEYSGLLLLE
jgi:hypothetical protein